MNLIEEIAKKKAKIISQTMWISRLDIILGLQLDDNKVLNQKKKSNFICNFIIFRNGIQPNTQTNVLIFLFFFGVMKQLSSVDLKCHSKDYLLANEVNVNEKRSNRVQTIKICVQKKKKISMLFVL